MTVTTKPDHRGEREGNGKNHCAGSAGCFRCDRGDYARVYYTPRAAAGASGALHSLRPLSFGAKLHADLGRFASRECEGVSDECKRNTVVVPANAGTHNHRERGCAEVVE